MPKYINQEQLLQTIHEMQRCHVDNSENFINAAGQNSAEWWVIEELIKTVPAIMIRADDADVHACWMKGKAYDRPICSYCRKQSKDKSRYCPHCGSRMDLEI